MALVKVGNRLVRERPPIEIDPRDAAYIAGFFDGEGCVTIVRVSERQNTYNLRVMIGQNSTTVLEWIQSIFGGYMYKAKCSCLYLNGYAAYVFLDTISPYTRIKAAQANYAMLMFREDRLEEAKPVLSQMKRGD